MSLYLVTYDLNNPGQKYEPLLKQLRTYPDHKHIMKSAFLINTDDGPQQIYNKAKTAGLDSNDRFLVIRITNPKQGLLKTTEWDWINERL